MDSGVGRLSSRGGPVSLPLGMMHDRPVTGAAISSTVTVDDWHPHTYIIALPAIILVSLLVGVILVAMLWFRLLDAYYKSIAARKQEATESTAHQNHREDGGAAKALPPVVAETIANNDSSFSPECIQTLLGIDRRGDMTRSTGLVSSSCRQMPTCNEDDVRLRLRLDSLFMALEKYAVPRDRLILQDPLVYGQQEIVQGAQLLNEHREPIKKVLVKSLIQQGNVAKREHLLKEALLLSTLTHPNVLQLEAVCLDVRTDVWLVTCIPAYGDLKAYLRNAARVALNDLFEPKDATEERPRHVQALSLLEIVEQIASGMSYLETKGLVHGDLASRNCLIMNEVPCIVIGDLGISKTVYPRDYYSVSPTLSVPIKWMAPELLLGSRHFTSKSDVWAFGVTAWEIFALGRSPFAAVENVQITNFVAHGKGRLQPVKPLPAGMYDLLTQCWSVDAEQRPTFESISTTLWSMNIALREELGDLATEDTWEEFKTTTALHVRITADIWDSIEDGLDNIGFWTEPSGAESIMS
eukprot:scpid5046/ scgid5405/ Proto-oncogene tyrosine-protein kinase ROS; Proto-oncogene c-Ros; Proto-oncogene c-Ros-1; Receptor tyrosine kinase c-ros oncogene 1; c-Ros receptor tyrosine kinase